MDTSSLIKLWEDYPPHNPAYADLWKRFWEKCRQGLIVIPWATWKELFYQKSDDLRAEIIKQQGKPEPFEEEIEDEAKRLEKKYESQGKLAGSRTVGESDLQNIVFAKVRKMTLVSEEKRTKEKYKIPRVCKLPEINVRCIKLAKMIEECGLLQ
ncbi:MAG: DUF4411 family protein [Ectothiorhodospiraceae bacterium AqS1]|nr:DUF4411 family protein [Ectothiorhodospiraceae bacterium AqS1]